MNRDDVIRMAREAGIQHAFDSEGHWDGLTNETIIERNPDSEGTKAYRVERIVEILEPFAAAAFAAGAAAEREEILAYAKSEAFNRMHGERSPYAHELVNYIRARGQA